MRVMGIDPALAAIGHSILFWDDQGVELVEFSTFETPAKTSEGSRLVQIRTWLTTFLEVRQPNLVVIERPQFYFGGRMAALASNALPLGMAYGVIVETVTKAGLRLVELTPGEVKKYGAGNGKADKKAVRAAVKTRFGDSLKGKDDGFDAIAVGLAHIEMVERDQKEVRRELLEL